VWFHINLTTKSGIFTPTVRDRLVFFYFFWSFIRHVSSYQKNLGFSHFFIRFFKKFTTFSKMEISISVEFWISEIFIIIYQLNNSTQNGFLCKIIQLSDLLKYFFTFWHNLVTLKYLKFGTRFFFKWGKKYPHLSNLDLKKTLSCTKFSTLVWPYRDKVWKN
jgi:hypothetical protein